MNFVRKSLNSLLKLQQMFRIAEIELGMENTIGITLETGVGVQSAILHVCRFLCVFCTSLRYFRRIPTHMQPKSVSFSSPLACSSCLALKRIYAATAIISMFSSSHLDLCTAVLSNTASLRVPRFGAQHCREYCTSKIRAP